MEEAGAGDERREGEEDAEAEAEEEVEATDDRGVGAVAEVGLEGRVCTRSNTYVWV